MTRKNSFKSCSSFLPQGSNTSIIKFFKILKFGFCLQTPNGAAKSSSPIWYILRCTDDVDDEIVEIKATMEKQSHGLTMKEAMK